MLPGAHAISFPGLARRTGVRTEPLWTINQADGSVELAEDLTEDEAELARGLVVRALARLYDRQLLPFKTKNYARRKGVLDRVPLELFFAKAGQHLAAERLEHCLEWGPFFTRWPNVTQPYMKRFNCEQQWTFHHDAKQPRVRTFVSHAVFGELDRSVNDQDLGSVRNKFDLVIIPQTLQYVVDPHLSMKVLYDLVKPGGWLVFSTPFIQTTMPYPQDYYRYTVEGNELILRQTGFQVVQSFVGGDDFWSICWILHCGVSDVPSSMMQNALQEHGNSYSRNAYMLSVQLARKPELSLTSPP